MPYSSTATAPYKAEYASFLVAQQVEKDLEKFDSNTLNEILAQKSDHVEDITKSKVCIIGAGMAGLYAAKLLQKAGVPFDILEASTRAGGRVLTHYFSDQPHDYYDIGAMRFPKIPIMDRTFDLFKRTKVNEKLVRYYLKGKNIPTRYNDITVRGKPNDDPFHVSDKYDGPVPYSTVDSASDIMSKAYKPFRIAIKEAVECKDPEERAQKMAAAWEYLMSNDKYSLRDYLVYKEEFQLDRETIHWLETTQSATGWFTQAFTENVLESLAFEWEEDAEFEDSEDKPPRRKPEGPLTEDQIVDRDGYLLEDNLWYCVEGGTSQLTNALAKQFNQRISFGKRVTKLSLFTTDASIGGHSQVAVSVHDEPEPRTYSAVINTTTLAALQKMDLTEMKLQYRLKAAIRSIHYDTSTKVGMKFKYPWWIKDCNISLGGVAKTDMPLRVCVYPSYNLHDEGEAVLLCSYAWGQDAERVAAYINESDADHQVQLKELMIYNLARLHSNSEDGFIMMKKLITDAYITHHAYDWSKDLNSASAFALFSPGDFTHHYPSLVRPSCDSRLFIVGEAASAHHAWIVGSLDSAMRGVSQLLSRFNRNDLKTELETEFGKAHELDEGTLPDQIRLGRLSPDEIGKTQPST